MPQARLERETDFTLEAVQKRKVRHRADETGGIGTKPDLVPDLRCFAFDSLPQPKQRRIVAVESINTTSSVGIHPPNTTWSTFHNI